MKKLAMAMLVGAVAACGGARDAFEQATPTYDTVAMDMTEGDAVTAAAPTQAVDASNLDTDPCHPHLFARTRMIVRATNGGIFKLLAPLHDVIRFPKHRDGSSHTWERVRDGYYWKYAMTKTGDHSFTATLQVRKETDPDTALVTVYSAQSERNPADHDGSGSATMDFTALHSVVTAEPVQGTVSISFVLDATSKKVIYTMAGFHNGSDAPRDGKYVFFKEPGKGGSLKFKHDMFLACVGQGGMTTGTTPVSVVGRWTNAAEGVHFRSDALATGGQIAAGAQWEGVTCAANSRTADEPSESYWMMKLEDGTGATVAGSAHETTSGSAACDPAFGPVPKIDSATADYDFASIDFTSDAVVPFPGM